MSCVNIYKNADKTKYDVKVAGITKEGEWYDLVSTDFSSDNWLEGATKITDHFTFLKSFDVVFPVLHGQFGEDGTIQGLLEMAQIPYVGCRVMASCTAMDKIYAKKLFDQANIPQVPSLYVKKRYDDKLVVFHNIVNEYLRKGNLYTLRIPLLCESKSFWFKCRML